MTPQRRAYDEFKRLSNTLGGGETITLNELEAYAIREQIKQTVCEFLTHEMTHNGLLTVAGYEELIARARAL